MSTEHLLILRQVGLRHIDEAEVLKVLSDHERQIPRQDVLIDMRPFAPSIDGGVWDESERYIMQQARGIRDLADEKGAARLLYFGLAEIPHVIALGAYLGDERFVEVYDHHRDTGSWAWPASEQMLEVEIEGLPEEHVPAIGSAVVRIEISYPIANADVDAVLGPDRVADVRIRAQGSPQVASTVRSPADVQAVRKAFRKSLSAIADKRPGVDVIHLFIAAPVPICFVIGQELHLRNNVPVQTYRYRQRQDGPNCREAILLTAEEAETVGLKLSDEQIKEADRIRKEVWPRTLEAVQEYAELKQEQANGELLSWYQYLYRKEELSKANPFSQLPPIWEVVGLKDTVDPEPRPGGEYGHRIDNNQWQLSDPLLVNLSEATADDEELEQLIRLFLFHEYLHTYHSLTKYNVEGVGRFANCLERLDYMADLYALIHQLDFMRRHEPKRVKGQEKEFLENQLDLILRSTWAFVPGRVVNRWQVRHVRRLLNWYWRHVQVQQAPSLEVALRVLAEPPTIELVGQQLRLGGGRTYMMMTHLDPTVELSLGLVTEDARFLRIVDSVNYNLRKLMEAFQNRDHNTIKIFFLGVFEEAKQHGGALPAT